MNEWWIGKDLKGNDRVYIEVLAKHLPGETEENFSQCRQCPSQYSSPARPEYESRVLSLRPFGRSLALIPEYAQHIVLQSEW
jgi:hypothetical protein